MPHFARLSGASSPADFDEGALARSGKPERTQRAIQRAKDPRAGVPLDSDRAIKSRVERAGRRTDKHRGIPASLAMHIASARPPLARVGAERGPREPLRGIRAQMGRLSPISAGPHSISDAVRRAVPRIAANCQSGDARRRRRMGRGANAVRAAICRGVGSSRPCPECGLCGPPSAATIRQGPPAMLRKISSPTRGGSPSACRAASRHPAAVRFQH